MPEHGETGGYVETYTLEDTRAVFETVPYGVVTTADVADALGCSRDSARRKLRELQLTGEIERRDPSTRTSLWYLPPDAKDDDESGGGESTEDEVLAGRAPEVVLKRLSSELGEAITVGETVYEDGDKHPRNEEG